MIASVGVVGAGTMGAGIAQAACLGGMPTLLHDPVAGALAAGTQHARDGLAKGAERGRWTREAADAAGEHLVPCDGLDALHGCDLVVEAAPERAELKRELFADLSALTDGRGVLTTNTSSIPIAALAGAAARPERVVGMHFFNPPALMPLVEVVRGPETGEDAVDAARAVVERMGKRAIQARDGTGFVVNRCGRPFYSEALAILEEGQTSAEQVDRICRLGGAFRMGPFELIDLVGVDVNLEVARSFHAQSFGEPRWRPSPAQTLLVAAGRLGRKTGHGFHAYGDDAAVWVDGDVPATGGGEGERLVVLGDAPVAEQLRDRAVAAGFAPADRDPGAGGPLSSTHGSPAADLSRRSARPCYGCARAAAWPRTAIPPPAASPCSRRCPPRAWSS